MSKIKPITAITMGDPAGIGPEIVLQTMLDDQIHACCRPFVIGSRAMLERAAAILNLSPSYHVINDPSEARY